MQDRPIEAVLAELGLVGTLGERGRAILEAARITHRGKQRLAESKLERAREAIDAELARALRHLRGPPTGRRA
ncbi:MAG: hypothetical protein WD249_03665 [Gaiellaceae bacterium]